MTRRGEPGPCRIALAMVGLLAVGGPDAAAQPPPDLKRMTLEELMRVEVSTVSRQPAPAPAVPAAVFVITQDDIRRSGATTLVEVLRLAPGVHVARQDGGRHAVGVRGFTDRLSRAMLVLIDGRAVYSPLFAGTYWEVQDVLLEDVERVEVVRGPGGTLWGANAVNGVISIVTRRAAQSQGLLVKGAAGTLMAGPAAARYGGRLGERGHYRLYGKAATAHGFAGGDDPFDRLRLLQGGGRADWEDANGRLLTVQGDVYAAELGQRVAQPIVEPPFSRTTSADAPLAGANLVARWSGPWQGGRLQVQAFLDRTRRDERPVGETRYTGDLDVQLGRQWSRHRLLAGVGYRVTSGRISAVAPTAFTPARRTDQLVTAFVHDELALVPDRLQLAVGVKAEHNAYSAFEFQPSARVIWTATQAQRVTASVTRAVRTPSRVETDYTTTSLANPAVPAFVRLLPNPGFTPEQLIAYELGYRIQGGSRFYGTVSLFFNDLRDVLSTELLPAFVESAPPPARLILPVTFANGLHGNSHGLEATIDWRPRPWLRATGGYSWLRLQLTRDPRSADVSQERRNEGLSPRHQGQIGLSADLGRRVQVDWAWRAVSRLPAGPVPGYSTSNLRLSWQPRDGLEAALVGQDLHAARHLEWPGGADAQAPVRRRVYASFTWRR
ncbi:MAG: TonB-dependent receptor plug domain-containing protein [Vicinamibacterales bacterium]